jgi:hypothetical protein
MVGGAGTVALRRHLRAHRGDGRGIGTPGVTGFVGVPVSIAVSVAIAVVLAALAVILATLAGTALVGFRARRSHSEERQAEGQGNERACDRSHESSCAGISTR